MWFRDWLRAHPAERDRYARIKEALSAEQVGKTDCDDYTRAKTVFFDEVQVEFEGWVANGCLFMIRGYGGQRCWLEGR